MAVMVVKGVAGTTLEAAAGKQIGPNPLAEMEVMGVEAMAPMAVVADKQIGRNLPVATVAMVTEVMVLPEAVAGKPRDQIRAATEAMAGATATGEAQVKEVANPPEHTIPAAMKARGKSKKYMCIRHLVGNRMTVVLETCLQALNR